jgi:hypothetical protein
MAALNVQTTYKAQRIYTDSGTGADKNLSIWEPTLPKGYFMIGHYAQQNHDGIVGGPIPIIKPVDAKAIAAPVGFTQVYADHGTGGKQDMSLWIPTPPSDNYVSMGTVASLGYEAPKHLLSKYACIRKDLVLQGEFTQEIYNDRGSGGKQDLTIWGLQPRLDSPGQTGFFVAENGYQKPPASLAQCLKGVVHA